MSDRRKPSQHSLKGSHFIRLFRAWDETRRKGVVKKTPQYGNSKRFQGEKYISGVIFSFCYAFGESRIELVATGEKSV